MSLVNGICPDADLRNNSSGVAVDTESESDVLLMLILSKLSWQHREQLLLRLFPL